ncbi:unnamed protein product [Calypogeia fissa]
MASWGGLRRASLSESHAKGGEDRPVRKPPSAKSQSRPVINRQCAIGVVTLVTVSLLVIRFAFSLVVLDPALSEIYETTYQTMFGNRSSLQILPSSTAYPMLLKEYYADAYEGGRLLPRGRILGRRLEKNLASVRKCVAVKNIASPKVLVSQAYHNPKTFYQDFMDMACEFKIFIYPHSPKDPFANIFKSYTVPPTGNYASEHYFKMALLNSNMITEDPAEADLFYLPFSVAMMRGDPRIGVEGIKHFVKDYVGNISTKYPYWDRSGGADHFYVNCHSVGKTATDRAYHVRTNAIQVVCSSSYHIQVFFPHKDATIPQVWPRTGFPKQAPAIEQRKTLAFFAGAGNSPVRALVAKYWVNDTEIKVYTKRISTPYDEALLTSKYCLHVKGFEVNTARLADAMHYGCVPIIIANYHDLPYNDVLDWSKFSLVVETEDIPKLKDIIKAVSEEEYVEMQKNVMQVRQHFQWHPEPQPFDAFYMVMYELWLRRHVVRFDF